MEQKINGVNHINNIHWGDKPYGTKQPIDKLRNLINYACSEIDLTRSLKRLSNSLYDVGGIMARPIGLVGKNYAFIQNTLDRNIGNGRFQYDGYATPIGMLADPNLNNKNTPWFIDDENKNKYDNYLNYINETYFGGRMSYPNFNSIEDKAKYFSFRDLLLDNNKVGVVRNYNIIDSILASRLLPNGVQTNNNTFLDSKLGIINNFFLNATLNNAQLYYNAYGTYLKPTFGFSNNASILNSITQGSYNEFGLLGDKGMVNGGLLMKNGGVMPQKELTANLLAYTPIDTYYDGDKHNHLNTSKHNEIYGDVATMRPSEALMNSSSLLTQNFIKKSMLGYDLLDNNDNIPDFNHVNLSVLKLSPKKYKVTLDPTSSNDYFAISPTDIKLNSDRNRYSITNLKDYSVKSIYAEAVRHYSQALNKDVYQVPTNQINNRSFNDGIATSQYTSIGSISDYFVVNDLISYTNKQFEKGEYDTLIARFHTDSVSQSDLISSAVSAQYGMSYGRNLLRKDHEKTKNDEKYNGYDNPYCRVWTYHYQYSKIQDLIRPLGGENGIDLDKTIIADFQNNRIRLEKYGVKSGENKLLKIAPTQKNDIKRCMFSIENLAWKNQRNTSNSTYGQVGPFGGRIMWFPPYNLKFNENVAVNWNPTQFIGRGESIYTYTNTERSGTLSFKLLIDHPSILNHPSMQQRTGASVNVIPDSVDDVNSAEQSILRFFAGCEVLQPRKTPNMANKNNHIPKEVKTTPVNVPTSKSQKITFFVYYPDDYSGVDDVHKNSIVSAIDYLINGIGCQLKGEPEKNTNIGTSVSDTYTFGDKKNVHGGYEMGNGPISKLLSKTTHSFEEKNSGTTICVNKCLNKNKTFNNWGYRVDNGLKDEVFRNKDNYFDITDFKLNSEINENVLKTYKQTYEGDLYSLAEVYCALIPNAINHIPNVNKTKVNILSKLFNDFEVTEIIGVGNASSHGYTNKNEMLGKQRAKTVIQWLNGINPKQFNLNKGKIIRTNIGGKLGPTSSVSDLEAKIWRSAKIVISFGTANLSALQEKSNNRQNYGDGSTSSKGQNNADLSAVNNNLSDSTNQANKAIKEAKNAVNSDKLNEDNDNNFALEYKFFKEISKTDSFLHNKIVDKIKYFDPAYHSITPEGFNARLTFLHQCTRQGNTLSASDLSMSRTASNLSFGAPPVCVLRIGDFYHTKIIIDSLQITYDDASWDLNDEGIGVMPMMADISIGFKFLGGSDLSGPIARLQNAVSFNYYANTSVYDNRSDIVEYKDGQIIKFNNQDTNDNI